MVHELELVEEEFEEPLRCRRVGKRNRTFERGHVCVLEGCGRETVHVRHCNNPGRGELARTAIVFVVSCDHPRIVCARVLHEVERFASRKDLLTMRKNQLVHSNESKEARGKSAHLSAKGLLQETWQHLFPERELVGPQFVTRYPLLVFVAVPPMISVDRVSSSPLPPFVPFVSESRVQFDEELRIGITKLALVYPGR